MREKQNRLNHRNESNDPSTSAHGGLDSSAGRSDGKSIFARLEVEPANRFTAGGSPGNLKQK
jgi:hypothetical protein